MKKLRKVDTTQRKKDRKEAQEALKRKTAMFLDHPKECCVCDLPFERTKETVKTWQITTREERVRLTCPNCWGTIAEALKNANVKNS
jgi:predicted RNA-binding Zn-ribbon protein involved in translation (DUF1610 family)